MALHFDGMIFDVERRQVCRGGRERHLSPKAFELLKLLIERRPEAVAKADIHERLWPGTFVSDTNLPTLIAEIRDALGETAHRPRCIRTVHGFGYAFEGEPRPPAARPQGAPAADEREARWWLIGESRQIALADGTHVIGREDAGVVLSSSTVSRSHARIVVTATEASVEDLGSKNGTYVNDRRVETTTVLQDGDRLRIGAMVFTFQRARPSASTQTQASTSSPSRKGT
jgi:DNA-binding winged helix-turn-helix (wHTH) protein